MKYFLLIDRNTSEPSGNLLHLTEDERGALPFSLLPTLIKRASNTPEDTLNEALDTEAEATPTTALPLDNGDSAEEIIPAEEIPPTEEIEPAEELAFTEELAPAEDTELTEDTEDTEVTAPPPVLILTDDSALIEQANELGIATLRLPRRQLPLADLLCALPLEQYETVAVISEQTFDVDWFSFFKDRRCLAVSLSDTAVTYHTGFEAPDEEISLPVLLDLWTAEPDLTPTVKQATETKPPFLHSLFEWIELFVLSLAVVLLIMTFFIRHSPVIGSSMSPTLYEGDVLLLTQIGFTPETGDIIIIQTDRDDLRRPLVKRVIATEGQTVRIDFINWQIYIDGVLLKEDYLSATNKSIPMETYSIARYFTAIEGENTVYEATVPEGHLFVLGDNRNNSKDSRDLGFIDERHVIGEVVYRLLPLSAMGDPS